MKDSKAMHKTRIIGVSGQLGSGKDTVAEHLIHEHGFVRMALADPIKRLGYHLFLFTEQQLWGASQYRNAEDARFFQDSPAWKEAEGRLSILGIDFCRSVLGTDDVDDAYKALIHWFFWLKTEHPNLSPRIMLQTLGTEWGRESINPDIWINALISQARTLLHEDGSTQDWTYDPLLGLVVTHTVTHSRRGRKSKPVRGVVVSDVRFENELGAIRSEGGSIIRVIRPDTDAKAQEIGITGHASETQEFSMDVFDFLIQNESSLKQLYESVDTFMSIFDVTHH